MRNVEFETLLDPFLKLNSLKKKLSLQNKNALKLDENYKKVQNSPCWPLLCQKR